MRDVMKILAIRIGDRYGPEYETYLEEKLPEYEFIWIREPIRDDVTLQWNKMYGMSLDIDEPICVMDIDVILTNDYKKIFDYPIKPGEFLALPGWWREGNPEYKINGGFFKYYPKDCKHIYDIFMADVDKWQEHFIKNGTTAGPVNGEQYFVEQHVRASENLELKLLPNAWFTRWNSQYDMSDKQYKKWQFMMTQRYKEASGNDYVWMGEFHEDIKFVHFTHAQNKPTDWIHNEYK
tara:strand:+ start:117 stop:824 length:708 start_codon:yes stop_codon:yes gene_type:complete